MWLKSILQKQGEYKNGATSEDATPKGIALVLDAHVS